jgi:hypothetical protein
MTATIADIRISSSLIDDYLQIQDAPVAADLTGRFLIVQDASGAQPVSQLLTVAPNGDLVQFSPDPTSHSGWSTTNVAVPTPPNVASQTINRLAGFYQGSVLNVLAYFPVANNPGSVAAWMQSTSPGSWNPAQLTSDAANALGFTYQTDLYVDQNGVAYFYGVSGNLGAGGAFFLVTYDSDENAWDVVYEQFLSQFEPAISNEAAFRIMPGAAENQFTVVWIDGSSLYYQGASVVDGNFQWASGNPQVFNPNVGPLNVNQIAPLPGAFGASAFLLLDNKGTLHLVTNYNQPSAAMSTLTGADGQPEAAISVSVGVDSDNLLRIFVVEQSSRELWILRHSGTAGKGVPAFDPWVTLGNTLDTIGCPAQMLAGPELFMTDLDQTVYHMSQAQTDLIWGTRKVATPAPSTEPLQNIASYTMEVTPVDSNQNPIPSVVLSVTADVAATVVVDQLAHHIGPNTPALIAMKPSGSTSVLVEAVSLSAPIVTFTATDTGGATRWCQGDVVQVKTGEQGVPPSPSTVASRLANTDPNFPVTAQALQNNSLIDPDYSSPGDAVQAITAAGQWMSNSAQNGNGLLDVSRLAVPHWQLDFTDPSGPRFRILSEKEARERLAAVSGARVGSLGSIFGDIAHFFEHAWQELETFTVTVVDDALNIIFNDLPAFVIRTARQAASALEAIFARIVQGLKDAYEALKNVIEWLKQLFHWEDILVTHNVIRYCLNSAFTEVQTAATGIENLVKEKFAVVQQQITGSFSNLEKYFEPGQTFSQYVGTLGANPIGNSLAATPVSTAHGQSAASCHYVSSKAQSYYATPRGAASMAALYGSLRDTDLISEIINQVQANWPTDTMNQKATAVQNYVQSKISSFNQFFDLVIVDLLNAAQDIILFVVDTLEAILLAIIDVIADAISGLQTVLTAQIDIPVISWLYKYVITGTVANPGDDLTLLDLFSLIIAVPVTILYKIVFGSGQTPPFQASDYATLQSTGLPWPAVPSSSGAAAKRLGTLPPELTTTMGVVAAVAAFFGTFITTAADNLSFSEEPLPGFTQFISWASVIQGFVSEVTGAPWSTFGKAADTWNAADGWTTALWAATWIPFGYDTAFTVATEKLARFSDLGPVLDTGAGWALTGLAAVALIEQLQPNSGYTGWDVANALVPQPGRGFKFLVLTKDDPDIAVFAAPILLAVDLVLGLGGTVTQIGSAVKG